MIIVLKPEAGAEHAQRLLARIAGAGLKPLHMPGSERVVLGALGDERVLADLHLEGDPMVESVKPILAPYKLVGREMHPHDTIVRIGGVAIGGPAFPVIADSHGFRDDGDPCEAVAGASMLSARLHEAVVGPYAAAAKDAQAFARLRAMRQWAGVPILVEIARPADIDALADVADAFLVAARDMDNAALLRAVAGAGKPIVLKRGRAARVEEVLIAAEHILAAGNDQLILCEGGIRTFETAMPATLDLAAVALIKRKSHLPVIVDPSAGAGARDLVLPLALAAAACGADGLLVETAVDPALVGEGAHSLSPDQFAGMLEALRPVVRAVGRVAP